MIKIRIFLILVLCSVNNVFSQTATFSFRHYSTDNGLPSSQIYQVLQDHEGFLWFATDHGLSRYNGYEFTNFSTSEGLTDNTVFKLQLDTKKRLWMQSFSGQLYYKEGLRIKPYKFNQAIKSIVQSNIPLSFFVDSNEVVYFSCTSAGIYKIDTNGNISNVFSPPQTIKFNEIYYYEVERGKFVASNNTNALLGNPFKLYFKNNLENFDAILLPPDIKGQIVVKRINKNRILLSIGENLYIFHNKEFKKVASLQAAITAILEDHFGHFWISTSKGVVRLSPNFSVMETFLNNEFVSSILEDNEGGIWISTVNNGLFYLNNLDIRNYIFNPDSLKEPLCLAADNKGVYAGFWSGKLAYFSNTLADPRIVYSSDDYIYHLYYDDNKRILISKKNTGYLENFKFKGFNTNKNNGLKGEYLLRKNGDLINATIAGLYRVTDNSINAFAHFNQRVNTLFEDRNGELYLGTNNGIFILDDSTKQLEIFHKSIEGLRVDKIVAIDSFLCAATRGKGFMIQTKDSVTFIDESKGLCNNIIHRIAVFKNTVYCASYNGISRIAFQSFDPLKYSITNIGLSEGLIDKEINDIVMLRDTVWVASKKTLTFFPINSSFINKTPPLIHFTDFRVNQKRVDLLSNYSFSHNTNNVSISFEAISFKSYGNIVYKVFLISDLDTFVSTSSNRQFEFLALKPGNYTFQVSAMNNSGVWSLNPIKLTFSIATPFWKTYWFMFLIVAFFGVLGWLFVKNRISRIRESERIQTDFNKQLVQLEIKALRAQMNPHFIFNVINSIQDYILKNDARAAQRYLSKFAKLVRSILDNSVNGEVFLEDELKAAELYVELEQQRFEDKFEFEIIINEDVDSGSLLVPSMILQPFLENAIKHGISNLQSKGKITLKVFQNDIFVKVLISDNGIGRTAAADINKSNVIDHISYGSLITTKRVEAYNKAHNTKIDLRIIDLYDSENVAAGTLVTLEIPLKYVSNTA